MEHMFGMVCRPMIIVSTCPGLVCNPVVQIVVRQNDTNKMPLGHITRFYGQKRFHETRYTKLKKKEEHASAVS